MKQKKYVIVADKSFKNKNKEYIYIPIFLMNSKIYHIELIAKSIKQSFEFENLITNFFNIRGFSKRKNLVRKYFLQ